MKKIRKRSQCPFPNLNENWLNDTIMLPLSKLTGSDEKDSFSDLTTLSTDIDTAISAFVAKHSTHTITSLDELLDASAQQTSYEFAPKSLDSLNLNFLIKKD